MKTAKEMFEELGYKYYKNDGVIDYYKNGHNIKFDEESRCIIFDKDVDCYHSIDVSMKLLKIIYKQVEELGWNKEEIINEL